MTVRLPDDLADTAETIARVRGTSINQLIVDALRAEVERVKTDGYFQTRARELLERDTRTVEALAPPKRRTGAGSSARVPGPPLPAESTPDIT
jgi:hypothetical protein